ncbi:type I restriction-modification system subunit M [Rhodohalobacter halophilus]|uniref:type I restriction-modification system subunit M n=1 Tax=Rhodohalobacter halophilus TaxID=1812810 RepID=UPI00083F5603|nr:type I restriction-modification system subunit M [Rhodohalobacter halophilus]
MSQEISQDKINSVAWEACNTFRGVVDASEYKNYILVFLFIKYLSDLRKDRMEQLQKEYNGNEERIKRALKRERFVLPKHCTYDHIYSQRNEPNIGEVINKALHDIEENNKEKLDGVFRNIDFNSTTALGETKDRNSRLKSLIEDFSDPVLDFRPSRTGKNDIIGDTYEFLIQNFASDAGKKGGEFYTPSEVSELMALLLQPQSGERLYDPTCGSGSLLIKLVQQVPDRNYSVYGQESNGSTWALCKMNMFLHDIDNARIEWGDTIKNPKLTEDDKLMKFDVVAANPPFSLKKWGVKEAEHDPFNRFWRGIPPKTKGDYGFITHMVESLNEHGRMVVVVPHGVLFRGSREAKIREQFIKENLLDAVIGLPEQLFFGTGIPAALLVFKKNRSRENVLFIDASREYRDGKKQNKLREQDLEKISQTYRDYETIDKYSYEARPEELEENEYNLNIPRYVDTFEEEEEVDIPAVQNEIELLEQELAEVRSEMDEYLKELGF